MSKITSDCADETFCEVPEMRRWDFGFGDGRGGCTRTAVDFSIRYHVQVSWIYFRTGRHPSCLPRA